MNIESEIKVLIVEITFPDALSALAPKLGFPSGNLVGTFILVAYLESVFRQAGLEENKIFASGELNQAVLTIATNHVAETAAVFQDALTKIHFREYARVYLFDESELILRCLFPGSGAPVTAAALPPGFMSRLQVAAANEKSASELIQKILAFLKK